MSPLIPTTGSWVVSPSLWRCSSRGWPVYGLVSGYWMSAADPGALTAQLAELAGAGAVSAVDPSSSFVAAARARFPEADVRPGAAERLPFPDGSFDIALAQLVVHFMTDPVSGLREMARVTRPGGLVAACVWDHAGGGAPLATFWRAVHDIDPHARDEAELAGAREGHLAELCEAAGLDAH